MKQQYSSRPWLCIAVFCGYFSVLPPVARAQTPASGFGGKLSLISPGTVLDDPRAVRWNRIILLARPRIASGATTSLSESVRKAASKFTLSIVASVVPVVAKAAEASSDSTQPPASFQLDDVGVGYSLELRGRLTIVSTASANRLGANLGFLESQVLAENEKHLQRLRMIAKTSTLTIFDTPAILQRNGAHQDYMVRHLIWLDPKSGELSALVGLLGKSDAGSYKVIDEPLRLLSPATREDRAIHVDGNKFILGIPTELAFALEDLPPGKSVAWSSELRNLAAQKNYAPSELVQLSLALHVAMKDSLRD